jgi:hypothetical protein
VVAGKYLILKVLVSGLGARVFRFGIKSEKPGLMAWALVLFFYFTMLSIAD